MCDFAVCSTAALKICCIVYIGLFVLVKKQRPSPTRWILKGCFHSGLVILKCNIYTHSESLKGEFDFFRSWCMDMMHRLSFFQEPSILAICLNDSMESSPFLTQLAPSLVNRVLGLCNFTSL